MVTRIKNYNPKKSDLDSSWHLFDATGEVLGRLSTRIATILMGKHKPGYVGHLLSGDYVVVVNASKVKITGNKFHDKIYKRHSQYPGNLKEIPFSVIQKNNPERVIELAVKGMLPKNKIGRKMFTRLKVYPEAEHPHVAQFTFSEKLKLNKVKAKASAVKSTASASKSSAVSTDKVKAKASAVKSVASANKSSAVKSTASAKKTSAVKSTASTKKTSAVKSTASAKKTSAVKSTASAKKTSAVKSTASAKKTSAVKSTVKSKRNTKVLDKPKGRTSRKQSVKE